VDALLHAVNRLHLATRHDNPHRESTAWPLQLTEERRTATMMLAIATNSFDDMLPMEMIGARCVPRCSSCESEQDLYVSEDPEQPSLCNECRSPSVSLAFPNYYCDFGGQG
jgi:hypothetical protein